MTTTQNTSDSRFLRPTGSRGEDGHHDSYEVYNDGKLVGTIARNTRRNITGKVVGFLYTATNGDTHLFAFATPAEAAREMIEVQAAGGAGAVQVAYERANGWSTD